jgi:rhamnose transport system permease protein
VLVMAFVIVSGEIDLSVASVMGLAAVVLAWLASQGVPTELAVVIALLIGCLCGLFNGFWIAVVGLPSLAVTLAGLIGYRGLARLLIEDRSVGGFPQWFEDLGQRPFLGPFPLALVVFAIMLVGATVLLQASAFGRYVYVLGNSVQVARYSGVRISRLRLGIFTLSGFVAALAGVLLAARLGAVRGSTAEGFELDIITMVLLGGVSIFGGRGTMPGVILSILLILNLRNGLGLANVTGNTQTGVVGVLLILSVLIPNLLGAARSRIAREQPPTIAAPGMTQLD